MKKLEVLMQLCHSWTMCVHVSTFGWPPKDISSFPCPFGFPSIHASVDIVWSLLNLMLTHRCSGTSKTVRWLAVSDLNFKVVNTQNVLLTFVAAFPFTPQSRNGHQSHQVFWRPVCQFFFKNKTKQSRTINVQWETMVWLLRIYELWRSSFSAPYNVIWNS